MLCGLKAALTSLAGLIHIRKIARAVAMTRFAPSHSPTLLHNNQIAGRANYLLVFILVWLGGMLMTLSTCAASSTASVSPYKDADRSVRLVFFPSTLCLSYYARVSLLQPFQAPRSRLRTCIYETNLCPAKATSENTAINGVSHKLRTQHVPRQACVWK